MEPCRLHISAETLQGRLAEVRTPADNVACEIDYLGPVLRNDLLAQDRLCERRLMVGAVRVQHSYHLVSNGKRNTELHFHFTD